MSKSRLSLSALAAAAALYASAAPAGLVTADYSWTGAKGWRASGTIRYDDVLSLVSAAGPVGTTATGIEYLDLALYDSAGLLRGSWIEIANSAVQYNTLKFTLNTAFDALAAGSKLDIGNPSVRSAYFGGTLGAGKALVIGWNYSIVDTGPGALAFTVRPEPDPEPVPAPGTSGLLLLGLVAGAGVRRARRAR